MTPLFKADREAWGNKELPWEGMGCWSPVFPARYDDVTLLATTAVKELAQAVNEDVWGERLVSYEQQFDQEKFTGIVRVEHSVG